MKSRSMKLLSGILSIPLAAYVGYEGYGAYRYSKSPSQFEIATEELGFDSGSKQTDALLNIFYLSGRLRPQNIWQDLHKVGKINEPEKVFQSISAALVRSGANQDDLSKFSAKILRKNLFKDSGLDVQDAKDLILFIVQHDYGRKVGQERLEINSKDWMIVHKDSYIASAKKLKLIDRIEPKYKEYDECWICGASRPGLLKRLIDNQYVRDAHDVKVVGKTLILTGERELWADIDGISPEIGAMLLKAKEDKCNLDEINLPPMRQEIRILEGKIYISNLARKNGIALDSKNPFVQCEASKCPPGRFPGREYPNYAKKDAPKLTERLMAEDILPAFFLGQKNEILNNKHFTGIRPDTYSTAKEAVKDLFTDINSGKFGEKKEIKILYQTNNPYIQRQILAAQKVIDDLCGDNKDSNPNLKGVKIIIDGVGFACNQGVEVIHSELGGLIADRWKIAHQKDESPKRDIADLLYQTRVQDVSVPPVPHIAEDGFIIKNSLVGIFDAYSE